MPSANASTPAATSVPRDPFHDGLSGTAFSDRDDGSPASLRLDGYDPEVFHSRQEDHRGRLIQRADLLGRPPSEKFNRGASGEALEPVLIRTLANHPHRYTGEPGGFDNDFYALIGDKGGHHERRPLSSRTDGRWLEVLGVYWRIHNGRSAIIVSAYPARNILRISEKAVHTPRRGGVPPGQPSHNYPQRGARQGSDPIRPEIRRKLVPGIAHRGVAVADVGRAAAPDHRFDGAVAAADDQVVTVEIERLDRERIEQQVMPIPAPGPRQPLHPRGPDGVPFDDRRHRTLYADEGEDRRIGVKKADFLEDLFSPAHAGKPIVNDSDAGRGVRDAGANGAPARSAPAPRIPVASATLKDLFVDLSDPADGTIPREMPDPGEAPFAHSRSQIRFREDAAHRGGNGSRIVGIDQ